MRSWLAVPILLTVLAAGGCAGGNADEFTSADAETIRGRSQQLVTAFNAKQLDAIVELYADNSVFMPPNAPMLRGRESLREFYSDLVSRATNLRIETADVAGYGPLAYESGSFYLNYQDGAVRDRGKYIFIWRKTAGVWRTEKTIWSSDLPPAAPADPRQPDPRR